MPYLVEADLKTHVYAEVITEITRSDNTIVPIAIAEAIGTAKGYLSRFNRTKLFDPAATGYVADAQLLAAVKDICVWRCIRLANPNLSIEMARTNYEDAIAWLKDVQKGTADPEGWPYATDDADTERTEGSGVSLSTNTKRSNHY
ncbi:MAG: phage protein Gp36 family protein [Chitinophagaceae bacterium]